MSHRRGRHARTTIKELDDCRRAARGIDEQAEFDEIHAASSIRIGEPIYVLHEAAEPAHVPGQLSACSEPGAITCLNAEDAVLAPDVDRVASPRPQKPITAMRHNDADARNRSR